MYLYGRLVAFHWGHDDACWRARLSSFERIGPSRFFDSGDEAAVTRGGGLEGL
jgi:hypothetical protein